MAKKIIVIFIILGILYVYLDLKDSIPKNKKGTGFQIEQKRLNK